MPTPNTDESHDDFISRCIPVVINDGTAKSQDQAVAVCESLWKGEGVTKQLRTLRAELPAMSLETETFEGSEYLKVPVVALIGNTVVHSSTSKTPEFIPESVLNIAPSSWDGRPVVYSHPNGSESANTPKNLESMKIGYIFNTRFDDGKLKMEAWLRQDLADKAGASELFERLQGGDPIEVSVGSWTMIQQIMGSYDGQDYNGIWSVAIPDHLAFLPPNQIGACSIDMGCGAPRLNAQFRALAEKTEIPEESLVRVLARVGLGPDGISHSELHVALFDELAKLDPEFDFYIEDIYQGESSSVIYAAWNGEESILRRRDFTIQDTNLTLDDSFSETHRVVTYVSNEASPDTPVDTETTGHADDAQGDPDMSDAGKIQPLVERLVAHEASPFTEAHIEQLSSFDERTLETMLTRCGQPVQVVEPDKPAEIEDSPVEIEEPRQLTDEEWLEAAPAHVRAMVQKYERKEKEERKALIAKLSKAQKTFTADELNDKDTDELSKLAAFVDEAVSYEGRRLEADEPDEPVDTIPDPWNLQKAS